MGTAVDCLSLSHQRQVERREVDVSHDNVTASNANTGAQSTDSDVPVVRRRRTTVVKREKGRELASVENAVDIEPTQAPHSTTSDFSPWTNGGTWKNQTHLHCLTNAIIWRRTARGTMCMRRQRIHSYKSWQFTTTIFHCKLTTYSRRRCRGRKRNVANRWCCGRRQMRHAWTSLTWTKGS